ncbi:MAG TPA: YicC/YloC family endoribonuclease [Rhabdochlamydiaceae bacterium]
MNNRRSMTAYGRAKHHSKLGRWTVDIHSVNRKGLDINIALPHTLMSLDGDVRKWISTIAERGQVSVRISFECLELEQSLHALKDHQKKWEKIAKALGYPASSVDLKFLVDRLDPQDVPVEEKALKADLQKAWEMASKHWTLMKEKEGKALVHDIEKRTDHIQKELQKILKWQPMLQERYRKKLQDRMKEIKIDVDDDRLLREAALLADKADISEEVTRLQSHLEQMHEYLSSKEKSVGRTLDFLAQEMGREIGTLMAKAGDTDISKVAIAIKSEVEKIREQVQNIE